LLFDNAYSKKKYIPYVGNEIWNSAQIDYQASKKLSINYEFESRTELDYEKNQKFLNTFGIGYKVIPGIEINGLIRVRHKNSIPSFEYMLQETSKFSINKIEIKHRLRFQYKMKDFERILRNKFEVNYKLFDNFQIGINSESFLYLYHIDFSKFQEMRNSVFCEFSLSKMISIESGFMYETEFNVKKPKDARIYFLGLSLAL
jgi:hypothetical protein